MVYWQRLPRVLFVAVLTMFIMYLSNSFMPNWLGMFQGSFGYRLGWVLAMLMMTLSMIIVSVPGLFVLKYLKVPSYVGMTLLAGAEGFWLSYAITPMVMMIIGWGAWLPSRFAAIVVSYLVADVLFNCWHVRPRFKIIAAISLVVLTALCSEIINQIAYSFS